MGHAQSTGCFVMFAAGSRYETRETNGLAHFVEHMLFCGTPRRPTVRALTGEVDAIGGLFNASTSKEYTYYYVKCASQYAQQALDVLADMVRNSLFEESEIEREKGVVIEELRAYNDAPKDYVDEIFEMLLYGDTPLGRRTIGTEESVRAVTRDTCLEYVGRLYEPSRMIVGLSGRIDEGLVGKVDELFGDLEARPAPPADPQGASNGAGRVILDTKQVDQAHLCLGMRAYPMGHPDRYVVQLLMTVLGGGMSSRLTEEVVMRRGLAYSIRGISHAHTDAGAVYAQAGVNVEKVDDAIETVAGELRRIAAEPVPADELEKARNYAKGRFVFSIETPQGIMGYALRREVLDPGKVLEPDEVVARLDAVTAEDVQRVAGDLLSGGFYLSVVGPFDDSSRFERLIAP